MNVFGLKPAGRDSSVDGLDVWHLNRHKLHSMPDLHTVIQPGGVACFLSFGVKKNLSFCLFIFTSANLRWITRLFPLIAFKANLFTRSP